MIKFRASSVGALLVGGNQITDVQKKRLQELLDRQNDPDAKPLTGKMLIDLEELIAKRDAPFEFGATAMTYIRDCWLRNEYGYDEPLCTNEMLKGIACEDDAIGVVTRQVDGPFRFKNEDAFSNDWFTGTPDVITDDAVEDVKCSWTLKTYCDVEHPSAIYYAQGQVYMDLTGRDTFRLCYVLLPTPEQIVQEEQKRYYFRFDCDEENPHYIDAYNRLTRMHDVSQIPEDQRIKVFEFHREDMYLAKLRKRVELANKVYESLTLKGDA